MDTLRTMELRELADEVAKDVVAITQKEEGVSIEEAELVEQEVGAEGAAQ